MGDKADLIEALLKVERYARPVANADINDPAHAELRMAIEELDRTRARIARERGYPPSAMPVLRDGTGKVVF